MMPFTAERNFSRQNPTYLYR